MSDRAIRSIFFWFLVILFFIATPTAILYSFGYRFNQERGIFIYGGSVSLKANPPKMDILVDGEKISAKKLRLINNSYHIDGVKPGEYQLKVSTPGFHAWNKRVSIRSGLSTEFWNIYLIRENYQRKQYASKGADNFYLSPRRNLAAYMETDTAGISVNILDQNNNESRKLFINKEYRFFENEKENIEWSPESRSIIIPAQSIENPDNRTYFIVQVQSADVVDLGKELGITDLRNVRWDPFDNDLVYGISNNKLYQINLADFQKEIVAENISSYDLSSNGIYYFQLPNGIVYRKDLENELNPVQITTASPDMSDPQYKIIVYDDSRISLISKNSKRLFVHNAARQSTHFRELGKDVQGVQYSDDGKKLLFWTDWEIRVYFNNDWNVQPVRQENDLIDVTRFSQPIQNVQWTKDYEHVIYSTRSSIKVTEIDNRDHRNTFDITQSQVDNPRIVSDFADNQLFFIDKDENGNSFIYSIIFPEKTGLFSKL